MKKSNRKHSLRLCSILLFGLLWSNLSLSDPLKLVTSSWPPYIGKSLPQQGVAVDIVVTAFAAAGVETTVIMEPSWKAVREGMEAGVYDVILGTWYSDERARFHRFSEPFMMNRLNFIRRKGSKVSYQTLADLEGVVVATVNEYAYGEEFESTPGLYQIKSNHEIQALVNLMEGKADLALGDIWVIRHELKSYMPSKLQEIDVIKTPLSEKGLRIATSLYNENGESIITQFNAAIASMKKEGVLDSIIEKHKGYYQ